MTPLLALKADTYRQYARTGPGALIRGLLEQRTFRVVVTMRLCQFAAASRNPVAKLALPIFRVLHRLATHAAAMDFSWRTKVGGGLALTHGWGLVVGENSTIGNNVTLFNGVTLGQRPVFSSDGQVLRKRPVLEDEVWVGPHAVLVGDITIGHGSRIAAGAFVTESVPPYSLVIGNPARIVRSNCTPDGRNRAPISKFLLVRAGGTTHEAL